MNNIQQPKTLTMDIFKSFQSKIQHVAVLNDTVTACIMKTLRMFIEDMIQRPVEKFYGVSFTYQAFSNQKRKG